MHSIGEENPDGKRSILRDKNSSTDTTEKSTRLSHEGFEILLPGDTIGRWGWSLTYLMPIAILPIIIGELGVSSLPYFLLLLTKVLGNSGTICQFRILGYNFYPRSYRGLSDIVFIFVKFPIILRLLFLFFLAITLKI